MSKTEDETLNDKAELQNVFPVSQERKVNSVNSDVVAESWVS